MANPTDTVPIPADRLFPIATEAASGAKTVASVVCFFVALVTIMAIGMIVDGSGSTTEKTMDGGSMIAGIAIWFVVLGAIASRFLKTSKRATEVASLAKANVGHQFFLEGKQVITADPTGTPQHALAFKLSERLRRKLIDVPRATVVR